MADKLSRSTLKNLFSDGERPTGENFESAWKSFLHQDEDGLSYDGKNLVIASNTGIKLGNPDGGPEGVPGTLRFDGSHVQYYDPVANDFKNIAGEAGVFLPVGDGAAFNGNVGIGTASTAPTHRLEVTLNDNTDAGQQVLLGKLVIHNGPATKSGAYLGNNALATDPKGYALFQDSVGTTKINASHATGSQLSLAINDEDKLVINQDGDIVLSPDKSVAIRGEVSIGTRLVGHKLTVNNPSGTEALYVNGVAAKTGSLVWVAPGSDERIKKEIRPYKEGVDKIIQLKPVVFKYNGKAGIADDGADNVGLIAQDVQKVIPEIVFRRSTKLNPEDKKDTELLNYDFNNVLFMFINAIKELNTRMEKLENAKKNEK